MLMNKASYIFKFMLAYIPLIVMMILFPFIVNYSSESTGCTVSLIMLTLMGIAAILKEFCLGICLGLMMAVNLGLAGILEPIFTG